MHWLLGSFRLLGEPKVQSGLRPNPALKDAPRPVSGGGGSTGISLGEVQEDCWNCRDGMAAGREKVTQSSYRPWHGLEKGRMVSMHTGRV